MDVSFDNALDYIKKVTAEIFQNEVSDMAKETQKVNKQIHVYDRYTPTMYDRTYEFLNSNNTEMESKVYKLNLFMYLYTSTDDSSFPSGHPSWVDGSNQNKNIPFWIQNSNSPSSIYTYKARDYITPTRNEVDSKLKTTMIKAYRKYGIHAS